MAPVNLCIDQFAAICQQQLDLTQYPLAEQVVANVPVYQGERLRDCLGSSEDRDKVLTELGKALADGSGVLVIKNAYPDHSIIDASNRIFEQIIADEIASGVTAADHFAQAGSNSRIWNALQKVAFQSPSDFIDYYANPLLALAAEAWLGPGYQITAQVNIVRPGNPAQAPHRDYHLGFQQAERVARYPLHAQLMSQYLTLQGAVAHSDMPLESGPTLLLPFSHQYALGYQAWQKDEFNAYFKEHAIQLPLEKGDMLFFNPALFHGAGENRTASFDRIANLLQVSSAFGKPMETVDTYGISKTVYPALLDKSDALDSLQLQAVIAACADGYSFPSNLDTDPPLAGKAPATAQQLLSLAIKEKWSAARLCQNMHEHRERRLA